MVKARKVQQTMKQQYPNLVAERVTVSRSLPIRCLERDGKIASVIMGDLVGSRKAEDVGRLIFAAEGLVQTAQRWIVCQQDVHIALNTDSSTGAVEEARQAGL